MLDTIYDGDIVLIYSTVGRGVEHVATWAIIYRAPRHRPPVRAQMSMQAAEGHSTGDASCSIQVLVLLSPFPPVKVPGGGLSEHVAP